MKHLVLSFIIFISFSTADSFISDRCLSFKSKIDYYKKLEKSYSYTGDFSDVIEQYENMYQDCLNNPEKYKQNVYRKSTQQTQKEGALF
jgi:hypothetical protein